MIDCRTPTGPAMHDVVLEVFESIPEPRYQHSSVSIGCLNCQTNQSLHGLFYLQEASRLGRLQSSCVLDQIVTHVLLTEIHFGLKASTIALKDMTLRKNTTTSAVGFEK